jgi:hypothetical protein
MPVLAQISGSQLRKLYGAGDEAKAVLDHFSKRERNQKTSTVRRLLVNLANDGVAMSRGQLVYVFKELEKLGCGDFKAGRKGHESRFLWNVSSKSVGQVAAGEDAEIEEVSAEAEEIDDADDDLDDDIIEHCYQLRPGLSVRLNLPADFSRREADRLAAFIKTLPFAPELPPLAMLPTEDFSDWEK